MKPSFLEKLLARSHQLGGKDLQTFLVQLAKEKGFFETIFNTLQEGILVLSASGKIEYFNTAAARLLSLPEERSLQAPISRYLRGLDWPELLQPNKSSSQTIEIDYPEKRFLEFYLVPFEKENTDKTSFVAIFHDVTQTQQTTQATIESERMNAITLLAASVAHELGNPLNNLNIHLQLIERDLARLPPQSTQRMRESLEVARSEMDRLDAIITQFLRAVRPTQPELVPAAIEIILAKTLELLRMELESRDILVEEQLPSALPDVLLDTEQFQQALYNILRNAIQAIGKTGAIRIRAEVAEPWLVLSFSDNGGGIAPEDLPRIRQPYFTTKKEGHGLGLLIVQRIVREHGGELEIESEHKRGTTIRIKLPLLHRRVHLLESTDSA